MGRFCSDTIVHIKQVVVDALLETGPGASAADVASRRGGDARSAVPGGSVGGAEGEAIIYGVQHAIDNKTPYVFFPCGGGQRMFESAIALANMTRTTLAINELKKNNLPYIVCFTDPTAGGITASFAMLGDIHFAETGCLIAFAGKRVIQATVKEELSPDFQTAEFVEKHGFVDKVVKRKDLTNEVGKLLEILLKKNSEVNSELSNETSKNIEQSTKAAS